MADAGTRLVRLHLLICAGVADDDATVSMDTFLVGDEDFFVLALADTLLGLLAELLTFATTLFLAGGSLDAADFFLVELPVLKSEPSGMAVPAISRLESPPSALSTAAASSCWRRFSFSALRASKIWRQRVSCASASALVSKL